MFLGKQENTLPIIRQFDVGVICSESEGFSNSIIEYIYCGVPVVCTDTGGNGEIIIDEETGYLVPVGDTEKLAGSICRVINNPNESAQMAKKARDDILGKYNMNHILKQYDDLYKSL